MPKSKKDEPRISVRLTGNLLTQIRQAAKETERTPSAYIRFVMQKHVAANAKTA